MVQDIILAFLTITEVTRDHLAKKALKKAEYFFK